ncbi:amidohydrolase [Microbacterium sp. zg-Y818]|uniref:amidohydrolase n=1 Tax=unclassified Microbacterium TaxID=2609290 RepID=UPI00214B6458|nr:MULTISPECIES: amidohydrolase [unclassified Microbacterium]MCR2799562.1 amidohydrolase [Microbacterium sp. zg.Y818]WIM21556.1 amidohydrolase [Microbacterium sp. zg-Y818]
MPASPRALPLVDLVLRGGRITTFADPQQAPEHAQSVAVAGGRVIAVGTDDELAPHADLAARVIELEGRDVIPGLNDSHIHAVRGGNSWSRSLHWEGVRSVSEALNSIHDAATRLGPGQWISAVGGWHRSQFEEGRTPTPTELEEAAPHNPVYVQELYDVGILNEAGLAACGFADGAEDPPRGRIERDDTGRPTGRIHGVGAFAAPIGHALAADEAQAGDGLRSMLAEFARHGLTGVVDGGGLLMTPRDYDPVYGVWRDGALDVRVRLFFSAWTRGGEVGDIDALTSLVPADVGDGLLRVVGIGEIPHLGCHDLEGLDPFAVSDAAFEELVDIVRLCARRRWRMSIHAVLDDTLGRVLDAWERIEAETGLIAGRGWSIVHADEASRANLERVARLGAGILVQNRLILKGGDYVEAWGPEATAQAPPLGTMRELGIVIGGGTDATRANWFSPWASIWWLATGRTLDGRGTRLEQHRLTRRQAIAAFTRDAAWFTGEQDHRGRIAPGYDADFCVPSADPFGCADDALRDIRSDLTVLAGRITHQSTALVP